ncbi:MAG: MotA/TolQ/ExbB proton channel family protein [Planctomycetota bacterium]
MLTIPFPIPTASLAILQEVDAESLFELIERGGVLMVPIALASFVALAFAIERLVGLRAGALGSKRLQRDVVDAARTRGRDAALGLCREQADKPLARILAAGLARTNADFAEREKVVEDAANGEVRRLARNLRPLFLVWLIAPLLGLLGTVWGMIKAFKGIAGEGGIGRPEVLADGIYGALSTTAAGLAVAIPSIVAYWYLQGRIEAFAARVEEAHRGVEEGLSGAVTTGPRPSTEAPAPALKSASTAS